MIQLTWNEMTQKGSRFNEKFDQALKDGFFYVEIPKNINEKIAKVVEYAESIRDNKLLKTGDFGNPRMGYQERRGTQAVAFSAMSHKWEQVFPNEIVEVASEMNKIAIEILKTALQHLSISEKFWSEATGKLTDSQGSNVFTLNHYKPGEQKIGLIPHKDMGWITILFINKIGLETSEDGKNWVGIPPKEGHFVVNFGQAFEILVHSTDKLKASLHRVRYLTEERISFGIFINHTAGSAMYQINNQGSLTQLGTYEQYIEKCMSEFNASFDAFQKQLENQDNSQSI